MYSFSWGWLFGLLAVGCFHFKKNTVVINTQTQEETVCGAAAVQVWSAGVPDTIRVHKAKHLPSPTRASFAVFTIWPLRRWDMSLGPQPGRRQQHEGHQHPCIFITVHVQKEERKTPLLLGTKYWVN